VTSRTVRRRGRTCGRPITQQAGGNIPELGRRLTIYPFLAFSWARLLWKAWQNAVARTTAEPGQVPASQARDDHWPIPEFVIDILDSIARRRNAGSRNRLDAIE
jgi:hypothetical protein